MKLNTANILIVDDQPDNIRTLSTMLSQEGYKVRKALSGEIALETAQALPPDLILLDILMPHMNGYEVCASLKASTRTREIPVIFLSALSEIADKTRAFTVGGMDYITKPFQVEEVLLRVRHQITLRRQQQELMEQNRRLQQEIAKRHQAEAIIRQQSIQERLLGDIIRHIRQSLQLEEILTIAVEEIRRFMNVDHVFMCRFDAEWRGEVVAEAVVAGHASLLAQTIDDPRWQTYWRALFHPHPTHQYTGETPDAPLDYAIFLSELHLLVNLSFPILNLETPWGLVVAHHSFVPRAWSPLEIDFLQQLTDQLAIAIRQSDLYHHLETQVQEQTAGLQQSLEFEALLKHITDKVRDSLDEHQVLQAVVDELAAGLDIEGCETNLYNAELTTSTATYRNATCRISTTDHTAAITVELPYEQLLQKQVTQFCKYPLVPDPSTHQAYTVLVCPIFDDQQILGDLRLYKVPDTGFRPLEVRLIKQVANQCAIALRQARLYMTAQRQVKELQRLNQLKDDFLSTISHELRTPLTNIKIVVRLLSAVAEQNESTLQTTMTFGNQGNTVADYLKILQDECDRELQLIQDLLDLQHIEAGSHPLQLKPMRLDVWLPHILESFEHQARSQQQTLQFHLAPTLSSITTDYFSLSRILTELVNNACKYTPANESITVAAYRNDDRLILTVTNSGVEISASDQAQIFDKFYRIPKHDPWKHGGTGLGLALVKRLVEYLNGTIAVTSYNNLTCFTVTLPLSPGDRYPSSLEG